MYILGFDIGGTKCAVILGKITDGNITIIKKEKTTTDLNISPEMMIDKLCDIADSMIKGIELSGIGISCGGPLNSTKGVILSPPNLKGWDEVHIKDILESRYNVKTNLQNDANACAVAEWKWGAGKGARNMIFMTFGTGLGAGLILDGKLYIGTNDNAGEVGHIRLDDDGPVGYHKAGSFEGFCSGGGIAQLGIIFAEKAKENGITPLYANGEINAKTIADAAEKGDETAIEVYKECGKKLGKGLSVIIDILNPERIVIGSIFARSKNLLWKYAKEVIDREALALSADVCEVVPASLGEQIGDYAALSTALL